MSGMQADLSIAEAIADASRRLEAAGVDAPRRDARLLLGHALGMTLEAMVARPERILAAAESERFAALLARRLAREPVARILGQREFWSLDFALSPATLVPRPESETLIEAALALVRDRSQPLRLLDLGTGSGCLLLAMLRELPVAWGLGVDRSEAACRTAAGNALSLGLAARAAFLVSDWDAALAAHFDLVLANPPYVAAGAIDGLAPEVARHEPRLALAAGDDGLACYRALAPAFAQCLARDGHALLELGQGQGDAVAAIMQGAGLRESGRRMDLAGNERCLIISPAPHMRGRAEEPGHRGKAVAQSGAFC